MFSNVPIYYFIYAFIREIAMSHIIHIFDNHDNTFFYHETKKTESNYTML